MAERTGIRGIVVLTLLYAILSVSFILLVPLWEAPDEPAHFLRIREEARRLGLIDSVEPSRWLMPPNSEAPPADHPGPALQRREGFWKKGAVVSGYERHQPPGYYLLAAPLLAATGGDGTVPFFFNHQYETRPGQVFFHGADRDPPFAAARRSALMLRLLSTLFGAATVVLVWLIARAIGFGTGPLPLTAAALTAFLPQFIFITSVINNDAMALFLSALFLYLLVQPRTPGSRSGPARAALLMLVLAAGLFTEFALIFLVPAALAWYAATGRRRSRLRTTAALSSAILLPLLLMAAPGRLLTGGAHWAPLRHLDRLSTVGTGLLKWESLRETVRLFFTSAWGVFGWMSVLPPLLLTAAYLAVSILVVLGLIRLLGPGAKSDAAASPVAVRGVPALFAAGLICLAILVLKNALFTFQPQGRMLFPLLPLAAPLSAAGLQFIGRGGRAKSGRVVIGFMIVASLYSLIGMIRPFYTPDRAPIRFTLPAESAILYGLYGAGFTVHEQAGHSTLAGLERTGALRLYNPGHRDVAAMMRFTAAPAEQGMPLEVWDRHERIGRFALEPGGRRFFQLDRLDLPPGESVLFFHLAGTGEPGRCRISGLVFEDIGKERTEHGQ